MKREEMSKEGEDVKKEQIVVILIIIIIINKKSSSKNHHQKIIIHHPHHHKKIIIINQYNQRRRRREGEEKGEWSASYPPSVRFFWPIKKTSLRFFLIFSFFLIFVLSPSFCQNFLLHIFASLLFLPTSNFSFSFLPNFLPPYSGEIPVWLKPWLTISRTHYLLLPSFPN